ncbi:hypothetical protein R3P38DRAFT_3231174 [Favolaschia claudopus]|uniref:Secreted protein n=1 Tax=Favolaschia claudopus TaxID=2862362 RepID=A0AAV9ZKN0_9AGAR
MRSSADDDSALRVALHLLVAHSVQSNLPANLTLHAPTLSVRRLHGFTPAAPLTALVSGFTNQVAKHRHRQPRFDTSTATTYVCVFPGRLLRPFASAPPVVTLYSWIAAPRSTHRVLGSQVLSRPRCRIDPPTSIGRSRLLLSLLPPRGIYMVERVRRYSVLRPLVVVVVVADPRPSLHPTPTHFKLIRVLAHSVTFRRRRASAPPLPSHPDP